MVTFSISELSKEFDITTRTIRYYEDQGLLTPERKGTQRIYYQRDQVRLKLILRGKRLGFSILEIKEVISLYDSEPGEKGQLEYTLQKIAEKKNLLEQQLEDIQITLGELSNFEERFRDMLGKMS